MAPVDVLLEHLAVAGVELHERGGDGDGGRRWRGNCPLCGKADRLSVWEQDLNGGASVGCYAHCDTGDLLELVGLSWRDLRAAHDDDAQVEGGSTPASAITPRRIRWVWRGRLAKGYPSLWSGESSLGKSTLFCSIASELTHGRLEGQLQGKPARVLIIASEDAREDVWAPRLIVAGADLDLVHFQDQSREWNLRDGVRLTERVLDQVGAELVFIDSVLEHMPDPRGGENINSTTFVRRALGPFADMCKARNVAGLISTHPPKAKGSTFADSVMASAAFVHVTRVGLLFAWHPDDLELPDQERRRVLMRPPGGSNIGRNPGALEFHVEAKDMLIEGEIEEIPFTTTPVASDVSFRDLTRAPKSDQPSRTRVAEARALIDERLADGLWHPSMRDELIELGFSKATAYRAAEPCEKVKAPGADGSWWWASQGTPKSTFVEVAGNVGPSRAPARGSSQTGTLPPKSSNNGFVEPRSHVPAEMDETEAGVAGLVEGRTPGSSTRARELTVFLDVETTGLDPRADRLVLVCVAEGMTVEVLDHPRERDRIQCWLELDADFVGHNVGFDFAFLQHNGYRLPDERRWQDTLLIAHVAGERMPGQAGLKRIARKQIQAGLLPEHLLEPQAQLKSWTAVERQRARKRDAQLPGLGDAPLRLLRPYVTNDVLLTHWVHAHYSARLNGQTPVLELEHRVLPALYAAEQRGVPLDLDAAKWLRSSTHANTAGLLEQLRQLAGRTDLNPAAARQIETALQARHVDLTKVPRTPKAGQAMFTAETLQSIDDELARVLLEYRAEKKVADYADGLFRHAHGDRLYGNFRQVGAATGRMSSGNPNLQNIPQGDLRVRYLIRAGEGNVLVGADLDSVELRLLAAYAPGGALEHAFAQGIDVHQQTADSVGVDRAAGKTLNYAVLYGAGANRISDMLGCPPDEAKSVLDRWYGLYPEVARLKADLGRRVKRRGYLRTTLGRRHYFEEPNHRLLNYLIQGSAADLLKRSTIELHEHGVPVVLYVHDEIVAEVRVDEAEKVAHALETALTREVNNISGLRAQATTAFRWSDFKQQGYEPLLDRMAA